LRLILEDSRIRVPYPFQWGPPTFHAGEAFAMMAVSFVSLIEVRIENFLFAVTTLNT